MSNSKTPMASRMALALAALALSACTSLAPEHRRPEVPVAAEWPDARASAGASAVPASATDWQRFYAGDARLRELIALALHHNRDLRVAVLNVEQARAQAGIADAARLPTVAAGVSASRVPSASGGTRSVQAGLQLSAYELDLFGRVRSQSDAAAARYLATEEGRRSAEMALVAGVAGAHLALQTDSELLALAQRTRAAREDSLRLTRLKFDAGAASALELRAAESAAAAARAAEAQAQRQRALDENALVLLIGQPVPASLPAAPALAALSLPELPAGLPSSVLAERPDVRQAEQLLRAAEANVGAARAALFPAITLTGSAGVASSALSSLFEQGAWSLAAQALVPIFDAGRNKAAIDAAQAAQAIAVAQYEKAVQTAFREVADGLAGRAALAAQLKAQADLAAAERERLRLVELRQAQGVASSLDLLEAQRSSFAAEQALLQLQLAQLLNSVQLYKALGGGLSQG